jgi:membrane protease YdiL (CAAX protease family)
MVPEVVMDSTATPAPPRSWPWSAGLSVVALWALSLAWYGRANAEMAAMAAGGAAYAAVLAALTAWLVRRPAGEDRLRARGTTAPLWAWHAVVIVLLAWAFLYGFAFGGLYGGVRVPGLTPWIADLARWWPAPGIDGTTLLNFVSLAAVPAAVLLALGAGPREMGLCAPVPGTRAATAACLLLPLVFVVWGFAAGKLTVTLLLVMLVHNVLSNGFTEELMCRGLLLPPLRSSVGTAWAVVIQGLLFGLIHLGGAVPEEGGDWLLAAAAAIALNVPMGIALGVIAVRTGSLALPTAIHVAGHVMKDILR